MTIATGRAADWRFDGACVHADPDLFFPISTTGQAVEQIAQAKAICGRCPGREPCLSFAQEHEPGYGIWGGTTPDERKATRRHSARTRTRSSTAA